MAEIVSNYLCDPKYLESHQIIRRGIDKILIKTNQDLFELCQGCDGFEECKKKINGVPRLDGFDCKFGF